jgi:hypothetical protein
VQISDGNPRITTVSSDLDWEGKEDLIAKVKELEKRVAALEGYHNSHNVKFGS